MTTYGKRNKSKEHWKLINCNNQTCSLNLIFSGRTNAKKEAHGHLPAFQKGIQVN